MKKGLAGRPADINAKSSRWEDENFLTASNISGASDFGQNSTCKVQANTRHSVKS